MIKTKESDQFQSDEWILDLFGKWFDPCPLRSRPRRDGLSIRWRKKTYCNPPYSETLKWVRKAIEEHKKGKTIVLLLKHDSSTEYYRLLHEEKAKFLLINQRIRYGRKDVAPFPSLLAVLN